MTMKSDDSVSDLTAQLAHASVNAESVLSFAKKGLKLDTPEDAGEIVEALRTQQNVETFILDGNTLGVDAAKALGKALELHPEFKRALWSDMFTGRLKSEIPEALQYLGDGIQTAGAHLVELDLSDNAFGPNGMKGLTKLLQSESCFTLEVLRLHNNGLGTTGGKMVAECLLECHRLSVEAGRPLALKVFQSGRGRLENEGSIALAKAFKAMGSLEEVIMPQNGIYPPGISALADAFTVNKNLRHLNLQDNTMTEEGAIPMAKALEELENLEEIHFGDCLLRNGGAKVLSKALAKGHTKLKKLNLTFNEINKSGAQAIAEAMDGKYNLELLEIDGNALGSEGMELVQGTMEGLDMIDALGSLSEDEGTDEEAYDDDKDDTVVEVTAQPSTPVKGSSVSDFLQFPSPTKLRGLGANKGDALLKHIGEQIDDIEATVITIMRMCSIVTTDDNQVKEDACHCTDLVLKKMLTSSDENVSSRLANAFLVNLGLIKSEDKKFKPIGSPKGAMIVLEHAASQGYFPKSAKSVLACFLSMPSDKLDAHLELKHSLLAALHK